MTAWTTPRGAPYSVRRHESLRDRALDRESPLRRLDWVLMLAVGVLCTLGALLVWGATKPGNVALGLDPNAYLKRDLLNVGIGVGLGSVAALIDYRTIRAYTPVVYLASLVGLIAVLVHGQTINGSHSWIRLPAGFEVQPSEFAKIALIVLAAMLLGERRDGAVAPDGRDVWITIAASVVPVLLILKQPDVGTVMVLAFVVFGVISLSGVSARWIIGMLVVALLGALVILHLHLLKQYQIDRFTNFTNPHADTQGTGYNTHQARIAIGSGGFFGKGLFHGTQTNGQFVPEQQTDFVFTVAGEELGLFGAGLIVLLVGVVLWRGLSIAARAEDAFGMLVSVGVVCWFGFQAFENIGMTVGIMPVTGLPLPFVSYGGSSMFASMLAVGLLQNVHIRSHPSRP
ncbi:MAG TPA: rod shape-determining protein RodA [Mycobacteriales bacterium]|nr:rod shape-determining protein RodA [Mycobacteriales bacterium]